MTDVGHDDVPRRGAGMEVRHTADGAVIVDADGSRIVALDATAAALWELCDGETDVGEITEAVCTVWDVEREVARRDVRRTMAVLRDAGVLEWDDRP